MVLFIITCQNKIITKGLTINVKEYIKGKNINKIPKYRDDSFSSTDFLFHIDVDNNLDDTLFLVSNRGMLYTDCVRFVIDSTGQQGMEFRDNFSGYSCLFVLPRTKGQFDMLIFMAEPCDKIIFNLTRTEKENCGGKDPKKDYSIRCIIDMHKVKEIFL